MGGATPVSRTLTPKSFILAKPDNRPIPLVSSRGLRSMRPYSESWATARNQSRRLMPPGGETACSRRAKGMDPLLRRQISASSARDSRADENDRLMNKARERNNEMLRECDFSQGIHGKYAALRKREQSRRAGARRAKVFPDAQRVNSSLRSLAEIIRSRKSLAAK